MIPDTNLLEQWAREETLVSIAYVDGEELVSKGYIRPSPLVCLISHVRPEGLFVREGGALWLFRFAQTPDPPVCPVVTSITPIDTEALADAAEQDALVEQMVHASQGYTIKG